MFILLDYQKYNTTTPICTLFKESAIDRMTCDKNELACHTWSQKPAIPWELLCLGKTSGPRRTSSVWSAPAPSFLSPPSSPGPPVFKNGCINKAQ